MTQAALGEFLDVTFQQVQKYEKGANRVGASRLHQIANALGVPVSEFFAGATEVGRKSVPLSTFAFDPQAFRIAEAFVKISDKDLRVSLVRLVETMARKSGLRIVSRFDFAKIQTARNVLRDLVRVVELSLNMVHEEDFELTMLAVRQLVPLQEGKGKILQRRHSRPAAGWR